MSDYRLVQSSRNQLLDVGLVSSSDSLRRNESPRVQQILLHRKLEEEIEKNRNSKVRYVDSELHLETTNNRRCLNSEVQNTLLNIENDFSKASEILKVSETIGPLTEPNLEQVADLETAEIIDINQSHQRPAVKHDCQVCVIKEMRQDLVNFYRMIQEHNEQISKLKAKLLKSHAERQVTD